jgi:hypothetical protein
MSQEGTVELITSALKTPPPNLPFGGTGFANGLARNNHRYFLVITESRSHIFVDSSRTSRWDRDRWGGGVIFHLDFRWMCEYF